jgi:hypothetical protein
MTDLEFDCEGCGAHVITFVEMPKRHFCAVCAWADEYLDPSDFDAFISSRKRLGMWVIRDG